MSRQRRGGKGKNYRSASSVDKGYSSKSKEGGESKFGGGAAAKFGGGGGGDDDDDMTSSLNRVCCPRVPRGLSSSRE